MPICNLCGDVITFRYINGGSSPVPIHESGRCGGALPVNDYSGHWVIKEDLCYSRECPECGEQVFFIRHNGGCCWIDPPLGPPWYKHSCFDNDCVKSGRRTTLCDQYKLKQESRSGPHHLCVISSSNVSWPKEVTTLTFSVYNGMRFEIIVKGNGGYLIGKLCIYDSSKAVIYPIGEQQYIYAVLAAINASDPEQMNSQRRTEFPCPKCNALVSFTDLQSHMERHYFATCFGDQT
jgi:predicted RNA-binding Zn-ribbon protein involved in translation (DUF1610 family)